MENQSENQIQDQNRDVFRLDIDDEARMNIRTMATWAMLMAITSVTGIILSAVNYLKYKDADSGVFDSNNSEGLGNIFRYSSQGNAVQLVLSACISLLISYFLFQFSVKAKRAVETLNQHDLNAGLGNLKNFFMALAIIAIIVMSLIIIVLLFLTLFV